EGGHAFPDGQRRVHVKRSSETLRQAFQSNLVTQQGRPHRAPAQKSLAHFAVGKGRETARTPVCDWVHLRLGSPFTLMATTVSSSKASSPAACSVTALNRDLTTQSAEMSAQPAIMASVRWRPNISPARLRASMMPSLKNTNMSPGLALKVNSSYSASSNKPRGRPVASMTSILPSWQYKGRGRPEFAILKDRSAAPFVLPRRQD